MTFDTVSKGLKKGKRVGVVPGGFINRLFGLA